jgi:tetratricopeptide (TPR) repeat protein
MTADEVARRLLAADAVPAAAGGPGPPPSEVAYALKALFESCRASDPDRARRASRALGRFAAATKDPHALAVAAWVAGICALQVDGSAGTAAPLLDDAAARFRALSDRRAEASVEVHALHALAVLGRYDEAIERGVRAREAFLDLGDAVGAGLIEQNLGNMLFRRDRYREAEGYYREARARYAAAGDERQLGQIDACLATTMIFQHRFRDAERLYEEALARAERTGQSLVQAIVECDLGCLALLEGRFDRALDFLERSRRRYANLDMPHESALAELELADAYLEVSLVGEAVALYRRTIPTFSDLGMRAEEARAQGSLGQALARLGRAAEARAALARARGLYGEEANAVGAASVTFTEAQLLYRERDYAGSAAAAESAERAFAAERTWARALLARWLRGEASRAGGAAGEARVLLASALEESEARGLPQVQERCLTSLGFLERDEGNLRAAEDLFERAAALVERLRSLLPSDEFRTAFVTDRLAPLTELARLTLADPAGGAARAFLYVERSRSRALADLLGGAARWRTAPRDEFEAELLRQAEETAGELNWLYNQFDRPAPSGVPRSPESEEELRRAAGARESRLLELSRQLEQRGGAGGASAPLDLGALQSALGPETVLVEYFSVDGDLGAFLVTGEGVEAVYPLARETDVSAAVRGLRLQVEALRCGRAALARHAAQLADRARRHSARLYDLVLRPFAERLDFRRLAVVPSGVLHYAPFAALHDGDAFLVERYELAYAPSAAVLRHCLSAPPRPLRRALLAGIPDERAPRAGDEVRALAALFPEAEVLLGDRVTLAALRELAPRADVVHLATHGRFRADNAAFSSLRLGGEWLTVRDAGALGLSCGIVTLSACETGMSAVAPGEELIGLARGFLSAGAPSLLATLWAVADAETAELMRAFYARLLAGEGPAAALRGAQVDRVRLGEHPFYWAPFVLLGRW